MHARRKRSLAALDSVANPRGLGGPLRPIEVGLVLPMGDSFVDGSTARGVDIRDLPLRAEEVGFDTVWTADELLWRPAEGRIQGWWEGVAMTGAIAAATKRVKVGTWVMSALHRNAAITAKAVETIDEISGGRFVLGWAPVMRASRRMRSGCRRITSTGGSRRHCRSSSRCSGRVARTSKAPTTRRETWNIGPLVRARAVFRS